MHANHAGDSGSPGEILHHETQRSGLLGSELEIVCFADADDLSRRAHHSLRGRQICPVLGDGPPGDWHRIPENRESQWQRGRDVNQPDAMEPFGLHLDHWETRAIEGHSRPAGSPGGSCLTQNPGSIGLGFIALARLQYDDRPVHAGAQLAFFIEV